MSVSVTLGDLERQATWSFSQRITTRIRARNIWPRTTKFGPMTHVGEARF